MSSDLSSSAHRTYVSQIDEVLAYINQHLGDALDLTHLASISGFSAFHFHRIFKALVGETPQAYVQRLRLEKAANLLTKSAASGITEIAFSCGFSSAAVFARSFKNYFGVTASQYIRMDALQRQTLRGADENILPEPIPISLPQVVIQKEPASRLAYVSAKRGYLPDSIALAWNHLFAWAQSRKLLNPQTHLIGIGFDDPEITPLQKCRYYACIPIPQSFTEDPSVGYYDLPAGLRAVFSLQCTGDEIQDAFRRIYRDWLPYSGFLPDDIPPYERYYYAPDAYEQGKYILDACIPLQNP